MKLSELWLVFWEGDGGDRESASVYYSKVVISKTEQEAKEKYAKSQGRDGVEGLGAIRVSQMILN